MNRVLFLLIALIVEMPGVGAAELWDYVQVGKNYVAEPKWATRSGKAQVEIGGDRIEIRVGYSDAADGLTRAAAFIAGTIQADHTVKARCTFVNTDAIPIQLSGHY
jgi:hypothetical protein